MPVHLQDLQRFFEMFHIDCWAARIRVTLYFYLASSRGKWLVGFDGGHHVRCWKSRYFRWSSTAGQTSRGVTALNERLIIFLETATGLNHTVPPWTTLVGVIFHGSAQCLNAFCPTATMSVCSYCHSDDVQTDMAYCLQRIEIAAGPHHLQVYSWPPVSRFLGCLGVTC